MSVTQFDNGYWYATELKTFAVMIGIPSASKLRKDELEDAIKFFLETGKAKTATARSLSTTSAKDVERGLSLDLPIVVYTNDKETKAFLEREASENRSIRANSPWEIHQLRGRLPGCGEGRHKRGRDEGMGEAQKA